MNSIRFSALRNMPQTETQWDVKGLFAHSDRVLIFGKSGAMKTWLLLDLAMHLASPRPWLNSFDVPKAHKVMYVDEEMGLAKVKQRVDMLAEGDWTVKTDLMLEFMCLQGVKLRTAKESQDFISSINPEGSAPFDVIILDSLRRVSDIDENSAQEVGKFWDALAPFKAAGITVVIAHHAKKGPKDNEESFSGSTDLMAGVDAVLQCVRTTANKSNVIIKPTKCRDAEEHLPFMVEAVTHPGSFRWNYPNGPASAVKLTKLGTFEVDLFSWMLTQETGPYLGSKFIRTNMEGKGHKAVADKLSTLVEKGLLIKTSDDFPDCPPAHYAVSVEGQLYYLDLIYG
jgi:hypothetical protein